MTLGAAVTASGGLFTLNGADGLFALDTSDPSDVRLAGGLPGLADARAIASSGSWLFVANGNDGLAVIDGSALSHPSVVKTIAMPGAVVDVRIQDTRAYLANDVLGVVIVDVSTPSGARVLGVENTPGRVVAVAPSGTIAIALAEPSELRVINVTDPAAPFVITTAAVPGFVEDVDAQPGRAVVAMGAAGVQIVDVAAPSAPMLAGIADTPVNAVSVSLVDHAAFVADMNGGTLLVDVSDLSHPVIAGHLGTVAFSHSVRVSNQRLVVADDIGGARVFHLAPPAPCDSLLSTGNIRSMSMLGDLAVAADASYGLHVIDPATRAVVGRFPMAVAPKDVFVADSMAYVAREAGAIAIVDLHDPSAPVDAGEFGSGQQVDHIVVSGDFGYLLEENGWLYEERISTPGTRFFRDSPALWTSLAVADYAFVGSVLYVANAAGTVLVIPAFRMTPVADLPVSASPHRVVIRRTDGPQGPGTGVLAYVAETGFNNGQAGVEVFDVTDFNVPLLVGRFTCGGNAVDVAFSGSRVVVAESDDGCEVFDLVSAARARPVGMLLVPALRVAVSGNTLVAAAGRSGVVMVPLTGCLP
jgi:hypothetical protein